MLTLKLLILDEPLRYIYSRAFSLMTREAERELIDTDSWIDLRASSQAPAFESDLNLSCNPWLLPWELRRTRKFGSSCCS
jgi:hypothetical protein